MDDEPSLLKFQQDAPPHRHPLSRPAEYRPGNKILPCGHELTYIAEQTPGGSHEWSIPDKTIGKIAFKNFRAQHCFCDPIAGLKEVKDEWKLVCVPAFEGMFEKEVFVLDQEAMREFRGYTKGPEVLTEDAIRELVGETYTMQAGRYERWLRDTSKLGGKLAKVAPACLDAVSQVHNAYTHSLLRLFPFCSQGDGFLERDNLEDDRLLSDLEWLRTQRDADTMAPQTEIQRRIAAVEKMLDDVDGEHKLLCVYVSDIESLQHQLGRRHLLHPHDGRDELRVEEAETHFRPLPNNSKSINWDKFQYTEAWLGYMEEGMELQVLTPKQERSRQVWLRRETVGGEATPPIVRPPWSGYPAFLERSRSAPATGSSGSDTILPPGMSPRDGERGRDSRPQSPRDGGSAEIPSFTSLVEREGEEVPWFCPRNRYFGSGSIYGRGVDGPVRSPLRAGDAETLEEYPDDPDTSVPDGMLGQPIARGKVDLGSDGDGGAPPNQGDLASERGQGNDGNNDDDGANGSTEQQQDTHSGGDAAPLRDGAAAQNGDEDEDEDEAPPVQPKRGRGRPKGSKNKPRAQRPPKPQTGTQSGATTRTRTVAGESPTGRETRSKTNAKRKAEADGNAGASSKKRR